MKTDEQVSQLGGSMITPYDVINDAVRRLDLDNNFTRDTWLAWVYLMRIASHIG